MKYEYDRYFYSGATFVVTELDGIRVIGQEVADFIQKVPDTDDSRWTMSRTNPAVESSISVIRPGSTSPSAIPFDALGSFTRRSCEFSGSKVWFWSLGFLQPW